MDNSLTLQAINSALKQDWNKAIKINQQLLVQYPEAVDTLNRLAYAYLKSGNIPSAKLTYKKVLKINKYNPIALKNLKWLEKLTKKDIHCDPTISSSPNIFLEEPGKTKIVILVDLAPAKSLCNLITAQKVILITKKFSIEIRNYNNCYIGALPDDLSHRLLQLIKCGNTYEAYIKSVSKNSVSIFIRELYRGKKYQDIPSFSIYASSLKSLSGRNSIDSDEISNSKLTTIEKEEEF